jgi:hypothetical protein
MTYLELFNQLLKEQEYIQSSTITDAFRHPRVMDAATEFTGPSAEQLHLWILVLELASLRPRLAESVRVVRRLSQRVLDKNELPTNVERTTGLTMLELLAATATRVGEPDIALRAVRRLGARTNELFLQTGMSERFLELRPEGRHLRAAAYDAFRQVERELAVACAEAGRMKLLSAVATGVANQRVAAGHRAGDEDVPAMDPTLVAQLGRIITAPNLVSASASVEQMRDVGTLESIVQDLVSPWRELSSLQVQNDNALPAQLEEREWSTSLREPDLAWFAQYVPEGVVVLYPFSFDDAFGFAAVTSTTLSSSLLSGDKLAELQCIETPGAGPFSAARWTGIHLILQTELLLPGVERVEELVVVDWDPAGKESVRDLISGWSLGLLARSLDEEHVTQPTDPVDCIASVIPSARLLASPRTPTPDPTAPIRFIGDPSNNLVGPWYERRKWLDVFGERVEDLMGANATCESTVKALRSSDLVIISGHGLATGDVALSLSDGLLSYRDLLNIRLERSPEIILSCCSAASLDPAVVGEELLGLTTVLLAIGARRVIASSLPVSDGPAAVMGSSMASAVAGGLDTRSGFSHVLHRFEKDAHPNSTIYLPAMGTEELGPSCPHPPAAFAKDRHVPVVDVLETLRLFHVYGR